MVWWMLQREGREPGGGPGDTAGGLRQQSGGCGGGAHAAAAGGEEKLGDVAVSDSAQVTRTLVPVVVVMLLYQILPK